MTQAQPPAGPLAGYRVLEMGSTVAGPFCGRLLADFGAEVIKVEPAEGDPVRTMGKRFHGRSLYAASIFRNKSLVSLDLRKPEGQAIARAIAAKSDVVVENFRPGGLEKWGLGYADLSRENPGLVMVRISGFGQTGPYSDRAGYGVISEAVSGMRHITGDPDRPPSRVAVSMTDYITGLYGAFGAVMALLARVRTGRGQYVDSALYECAFSFMEPHIPAFQKFGLVADRAGSRLPDSTPNNLYVSRDGQFIHITAMGDAVFRRLVTCMGAPQLAGDARFAGAVERSRNHEEIDDLIGKWTAKHDLAELESMLNDANVPATRIFTMADIFGDPHYAARGAIAQAPDDELGEVAMAAPVPRLSATPGAIHHAGHRIGQDTRRVLSELLGLDDAEIGRLERAGVVACDRRSGEAADERAGAA
ncbi:MAG TPA: CaiB/BaiF CoA-transferase family protein [Usitatibacter sp.]|nr:CaiB/BaiF CoA-transferase family protein [Usitatibacter sp.]